MDIYPADFLVIRELTEAVAPFGRDDAGRMIGKSGQDRNFMSSAGPVLGKFRGTSSGSAHFWRKILRDIEDLHRDCRGYRKPGQLANSVGTARFEIERDIKTGMTHLSANCQRKA